MVVSLRGYHLVTIGSGTGTAITLNLATANAVAGDWAVCWAGRNGNVTFTNNRAGWTETEDDSAGATANAAWYIKQLDATDISNNTITLTASAAGRVAGGLFVIAGSGGLDSMTPNPAVVANATASNGLPIAAIDPVEVCFCILASIYNVSAGSLPPFGTFVSGDNPGWEGISNAVTTNTTGARMGAMFMEHESNPSVTSTTSDGLVFQSSQTGTSIQWVFAFKPPVTTVVHSGFGMPI